MIKRRAQGRPTRGLNEVGSKRILEHFRQMLRDESSQSVTRKSLAEYAGITPALITYYFPTHTSLVREATTPIVAEYHKQLHAILTTNEACTRRLHGAIQLLLTCFRRDRKVLAAYKAVICTDESPDYLAAMATELSTFFASLIGRGQAGIADSQLLRCAVWGLCATLADSHIGRPDRIAIAAPVEEADDKIFDFMMHGLSRWLPNPECELPVFGEVGRWTSTQPTGEL